MFLCHIDNLLIIYDTLLNTLCNKQAYSFNVVNIEKYSGKKKLTKSYEHLIITEFELTGTQQQNGRWSDMKNYLILLFAIICNACANIFIKIGMTKFEMPSSIFALVKRVLLNPAIIGGIFLFVLALGAYAYILSKLNLSIAYPIMTSLGYMIVILISWLFLKETITMIQTVGFILIILGVWFVAR